MEDNNVSVESVELALLSDIEVSSALMMKDAYQAQSGDTPDGEQCAPSPKPPVPRNEDETAGPNAKVYVTKVFHRTPPEVVETILRKESDHKTDPATRDFYTLVLSLSMRLGDPCTTRFLNGNVDISFPHGMTIHAYSPKDRGIIPAIIKSGKDAISLSQTLDMGASAHQDTKTRPEPQEKHFTIPVGPGEKISGTYSTKNGYSLAIPAGVLLEYQGMLKNRREMFWEIFPPMPLQDIEPTGKEMQAVFSFIVQAPKNSQPKITARIEGRVKGNLWGVVPVKGSVNI